MGMKWYEYLLGFLTTDEGQPSLMRLIALAGAIVGGYTIIVAVIGWRAGADNAIAMAGIGAGLFGGGELFKTIQKRIEMRGKK